MKFMVFIAYDDATGFDLADHHRNHRHRWSRGEETFQALVSAKVAEGKTIEYKQPAAWELRF